MSRYSSNYSTPEYGEENDDEAAVNNLSNIDEEENPTAPGTVRVSGDLTGVQEHDLIMAEDETNTPSVF
jgi:hypothetical protein